MKGLPNMIDNSLHPIDSLSESITTKSAGNKNSSTFTKTSSTIPRGYLIERSANCTVIDVFFNSPSFNSSNIAYGITLIEDHKSITHNPTHNSQIHHVDRSFNLSDCVLLLQGERAGGSFSGGHFTISSTFTSETR